MCLNLVATVALLICLSGCDDPQADDTDGIPNPECTYGADQTCNDNLAISSLHGTCNEDGTCTCADGFDKNPQTGLCL
ncbi:MAG: hypothetical protein HN348_00300 [Proteobacteria bacterium]|nr:hypothetical protein [Pseudomonadota bacterium]